MALPLNLVAIPAVTYEYSVSHQVNGSGHPLNGTLRGYSRALVPWVPRITGYSPKIWIRLVPSNGTRLETKHPVLDTIPPLLAEEEGSPT
jgi:hypothetical protein